MHPALIRWASRIGALVAGVVAVLAFPAPAWWWLAWVGLAPVLWLIAAAPTRREALVRSFLAGAALMTALHHWLIPHLEIFTVPAAVILGLTWLPVGWAVWATLGREHRAWAVAVVPAVWVLVEWARSWQYLGGAWGLWGLTQWQVGPIVQAAALGGVWLLSVLTVATNTALAAAAGRDVPTRRRLALSGVAVAIPLLAAAGGLVRPDAPITHTVRIAGIQPGWDEPAADRLAAHTGLTAGLQPGDQELVVWGQSSVSFDPTRDPELDDQLRRLAEAAEADLLVNAHVRTDGTFTKTSLLYTPDGPVASYAKQRLVPFGEYIPLRPLLGWVSDYTEAAQVDVARGEGLAAIDTGSIRFGPLVSYESTFPDLRRELARRDVDVTVVQGATSTFQGTWAQPQQASYEAVRAVESGRPALLVAVSGTSAAFDARGRRLAWVPADVERAFVVEVPISTEDTPYVRYGDWVLWLAALVVAAWVVRWAATRQADPAEPSGARSVDPG